MIVDGKIEDKDRVKVDVEKGEIKIELNDSKNKKTLVKNTV